MLQDPVKYPENMSPNFKSFLKGLLNKVVTWLKGFSTADENIFYSTFGLFLTWSAYMLKIGTTKSVDLACSS